MRLFVAIGIPERIRERLWTASAGLGVPGMSLVPKNSYHITLRFFGVADRRKRDSIINAVALAGGGGFVVRLHGLAYFGPEPLVLFAKISQGNERIAGVRRQIDEALGPGLSGGDEVRYRQHVTVARAKRCDEDVLLSAMARYSARDFGSFTASSVSLYESIALEGRYIHKELFAQAL